MNRIRPTYRANIPVANDLINTAQDIESFLENLTKTTSRITQDIYLDISDDFKIINSRVSAGSILDDMRGIFNDIDNIGDYPRGYTNSRGRFEEYFGYRDNFGDREWDGWSNEDIKGTLGRLIEPMSNGEFSWADWADESGYPDLAHKIKKAYGKYVALTTCVSVEYSYNNRTITLYRRALGDPNTNRNDWISAFASGIFFAYWHDAYIDKGRINDILLYSLADYAAYRFLKDVLNDGGRSWDYYRMWRVCDMAYWPYSGALYFCDIDILGKRFKDYFFVRTFKRSLKDAKGAFDDLKAAYRTYEGYSFEKTMSTDTPATRNDRYLFDGNEYNKGSLAVAIVNKYIAAHPGITSAGLIAVFNDVSEIVITKNDCLSKLTANIIRNYYYSFEPKYVVTAADCDCVVLKYWNKATIDILLRKATGLGYTVTAIK